MTSITALTSIAADFAHDQAAEAADQIAAEILNIRTLEDRGRDRLDFHDLHVANIRRALEAAFNAGVETALQAAETAEEHEAETDTRDTAAADVEISLFETASHADAAERAASNASGAESAEAAIAAAAEAARHAQKANASAEEAGRTANANPESDGAQEFAADARHHVGRARSAAAEAMRMATGWHAE